MIEKRAFNRLDRTYPVTLKLKGKDATLSCETLNISRTGAAIKINQPLPKDALASLYITPKEGNSPQPLTIEAQAIWNKSLSSNGAACYGLRFTDIEEDSSLILRRLLGYEVDHIVTGSYLPEQIVTNEDIVKMGFKGSAFVLERGLGAKERRAAGKDETGADMMAKVAEKILTKAGCLPQDVDLIICSADPKDAVAPESAVAVQIKIGATCCPAFGISMSCAGWTAGIDIGLSYLISGKKRILVLASSVAGSKLYFHNPMHRAIFGDGAGGILLERQHRSQLLATALWANGEYYSKIFAPLPWSTAPKDIPAEYKDSFYMSDDQKVFFEAMGNHLVPFSQRLLAKAKVNLDDIDCFLLHYPSKPLFENSLKLLNIPREKTFNTFAHYGNLVAAEMPIFLDEAIRANKIKKGDLVLILTYGAGFTMGGMILHY